MDCITSGQHIAQDRHFMNENCLFPIMSISWDRLFKHANVYLHYYSLLAEQKETQPPHRLHDPVDTIAV